MLSWHSSVEFQGLFCALSQAEQHCSSLVWHCHLQEIALPQRLPAATLQGAATALLALSANAVSNVSH
jgi:hypothetical protein